MKAYSYARWSSDGQTDGDSERRQIEAAQAYAAKRGLELDSSHVDRGVSGYRGHHRRAALGRFLQSIRDGQVQRGSVLIIESVDRLSREPVMDAFDLFSDLVKTVEMVTLFDEQSYTRENMSRDIGKLIIPLTKMMVAFEESEKKSIRKREQYAAKRAMNKPITTVCPGWLQWDSLAGCFVERAPFADIVRQIFADLPALGKCAIASRLN